MEPTVELICPAPDATSFEVDGITYTLNVDISTARAKVLQRLQVEMAYDTSLTSIMALVDKGWEALNTGRTADGIYEFGRLRESLNGIGKGLERMSDINIVGLFYCCPGEDPGYDHQQMLQKLLRWEGRVASGFFTVRAFALLSITSPRYPLPTQSPNTSPEEASPLN